MCLDNGGQLSIQFVSGQQLTNLPESVEEQIELLLRSLQEHRCLLMLDNFEAVLRDGDHVGQYRKEYEGYGKLIRRLGEAEHQSTLMLTSREKPKEIRHMEGSTSPVRTLLLSHIGKSAGKKILRDKSKDLFGPDESWEALIDLYGGNPLALRLAATLIQDVFQGDISRFLRDGEVIFRDINDPLDQLFNRLSELERGIMYWLAIEREMTSLETLREDIVHLPLRGKLSDAMSSLLDRSMIETTGKGHFTLQPVIMEYVTVRLIEHIISEIDAEVISLFDSHALIKAQAKDYIRNIQSRLILKPIAGRLYDLGKRGCEQKLRSIHSILRETHLQRPGYAAGNILNLLILMSSDIRDYDFSNLVVWQAYLQGATLYEVNFAHSDLSRSVFTETLDNIYAITLNPGGDLLVAGSANGDIRFWDFPGEKARGICEGHRDCVRSVAFSPDGQMLASAGEDQCIYLWDANTFQYLKELRGHSREIYSVAFSPDGQMLAGGSEDQRIYLWEVSTGECLKELAGHEDGVQSVAFSPDGLILASGSHDRFVRLWDTNTGKCLNTLVGHMGQVWSVAFSPNGKILASCGGDDDIIGSYEKSGGNSIRLWDVSTGQCVKELNGHKSWVFSVVFNPNGTLLASSSDDCTIKIWDTSTYQCLQTLQGHTRRVGCLAFSSDGSIIFSGGDDQTIRIWDTSTSQCLKTMQGKADRVRCLTFSPNGAVLASDSHDENIQLWDLMTGQPFKTLHGHDDWIRSVAFSPDGNILASSSDDYTIRLWEIGTNRSKILGRHNDWIYSIAFNPDGNILASGSEDGIICLWDAYKGNMLQALKEGDTQIWSVAFRADGNILASGSEDHLIRLWNVKTGRCIKVLEGHVERVRAVTFSPNGNILASGSDDGTVRLWNGATGKFLKILAKNIGKIFSVAFNMDGSILACGSEDRTVLLWDMQTAHHLLLRGHTGRVQSVMFSPTQDILASGSLDGTIRLWNSHSGEHKNTLRSDQPYKGMNITGVKGLTEAQQATLKALGAIVNKEREPT